MQRSKSSADTKIPFLGDIPVLGNLFKRKTDSTSREELLIFLTPYVIQQPQQLAALSKTERARDLVPKSYSEQELDRFLDKIPAKQSKGGNSGTLSSH
jgi:type II secretory pathway component GspD/PulD (secretin)